MLKHAVSTSLFFLPSVDSSKHPRAQPNQRTRFEVRAPLTPAAMAAVSFLGGGEACMKTACAKQFSLGVWRSACHLCGLILCSACAPHSHAFSAGADPLPLCESCHKARCRPGTTALMVACSRGRADAQIDVIEARVGRSRTSQYSAAKRRANVFNIIVAFFASFVPIRVSSICIFCIDKI